MLKYDNMTNFQTNTNLRASKTLNSGKHHGQKAGTSGKGGQKAAAPKLTFVFFAGLKNNV
jgi:hypothetical protein